MVKAGTLKEKMDRIRKKLAEGKGKIEPGRERDMKKHLKRAQRRRRSLLQAEARMKQKGKKSEGAPAPA